jgi:hypothetical protein
MMQHDHERAGTGSDTSGRTSETTRTQAQQAGNEARREARGVADEAKGAASDVMGEARATGSTLKQEAKGLTGSLKEGLSAQARAQKDNVADRIGSIAERVHQTADDLRDREGWLAGLMDRGAQELDGIADDIRRSDMSSLMDSVEVFARRQPALFMGASVALGFALSRVARSGGESRHGRYEDQSRYGRGDYGYGGAEDYRPTASTAGSGYGAGYVDDRPERPDLGRTWPQAGTGHASPGMTTSAGTASPVTGLGASAQPGYGGTGAGGSVGTTGSSTTTTGTDTGTGAATKNSGKTADEGTTRGSNV